MTPIPSVACATGPDSWRRDAEDVVSSSRRGNEEDGPVPPQPGGQARLAADLCIARRRGRTRLQLPPRALTSILSRVCGRYRGRRPDLYVPSVELPQAYLNGMLRTARREEHGDGWRIAGRSRLRLNDPILLVEHVDRLAESGLDGLLERLRRRRVRMDGGRQVLEESAHLQRQGGLPHQL